MQEPNEQIWREWNALDGDEPSPVKRIARNLGMGNAEVAQVVFPRERFGEWADWHEPPLDGESESPDDRRRRTSVEQRARQRAVDEAIRARALEL